MPSPDVIERQNECRYSQHGDEFHSWDETWGDLILHVVERTYGDSLSGPGCAQSVEVRRFDAPTRLFTVSSFLPLSAASCHDTKSAREQAIDWMLKRSNGRI